MARRPSDLCIKSGSLPMAALLFPILRLNSSVCSKCVLKLPKCWIPPTYLGHICAIVPDPIKETALYVWTMGCLVEGEAHTGHRKLLRFELC